MATKRTSARWNSDDATKALEAWKASGLSLYAFAKSESIAYPKLLRWKNVLAASEQPSFLPVKLFNLHDPKPLQNRCTVTARLTNGTRVSIRGQDPSELCRAMIVALRTAGES